MDNNKPIDTTKKYQDYISGSIEEVVNQNAANEKKLKYNQDLFSIKRVTLAIGDEYTFVADYQPKYLYVQSTESEPIGVSMGYSYNEEFSFVVASVRFESIAIPEVQAITVKNEGSNPTDVCVIFSSKVFG